MPRQTKDQTRRKLRDAVVAEAVEMGFAATSVGGVVARAKVSAGTVYVHFKNKEDMLQQVFLEIKSEFHEIMIAARDAPTSKGMIKRMWFDMFDFVAHRPNDFLFLELGNSAKFLTEEQQTKVAAMYNEIIEMLRLGIEDGTLAEIDPHITSLLLVSPAMQLARNAVQSGQTPAKETVELVFEHVWRSLVRSPL